MTEANKKSVNVTKKRFFVTVGRPDRQRNGRQRFSYEKSRRRCARQNASDPAPAQPRQPLVGAVAVADDHRAGAGRTARPPPGAAACVYMKAHRAVADRGPQPGAARTAVSAQRLPRLVTVRSCRYGHGAGPAGRAVGVREKPVQTDQLGRQGQRVPRCPARFLHLSDGRKQLAPQRLEQRSPTARLAAGGHLRPLQLFRAPFLRSAGSPVGQPRYRSHIPARPNGTTVTDVSLGCLAPTAKYGCGRGSDIPNLDFFSRVHKVNDLSGHHSRPAGSDAGQRPALRCRARLTVVSSAPCSTRAPPGPRGRLRAA